MRLFSSFFSRSIFLVLAFLFCSMLLLESVLAQTRTVTDMRGKQVVIPAHPKRVVTLDDGFCAGVMTSLGVQDSIIALGSHCPVKVFKYHYPTVDGKEYSYLNGMNPVGFLNPDLRELPRMATYGQSTNFEVLAKLEPDLVFMRGGSCYTSNDKEILARQMRMIESLRIPLVVLHGPSTFQVPTIEHVSEEIRVVGECFGKEQEASALVKYLESVVDMIDSRTARVTEEERASVLLLGLSPKARGKGGAGTVYGKDSIEAVFVSEIARGHFAFEGSGGVSVINTEHVLSIDPDVIVLPTSSGYHPPEELYTAPYYQNLAGLKAVKNRRVVALPWTPCNCAKRIEYPIEIMVIAKATHPELFKDVKMHEWVLEFYKNVYHVDQQTAEGLRSAQWLDWTVEEDW